MEAPMSLEAEIALPAQRTGNDVTLSPFTARLQNAFDGILKQKRAVSVQLDIQTTSLRPAGSAGVGEVLVENSWWRTVSERDNLKILLPSHAKAGELTHVASGWINKTWRMKRESDAAVFLSESSVRRYYGATLKVFSVGELVSKTMKVASEHNLVLIAVGGALALVGLVSFLTAVPNKAGGSS